MKRQFQEEYGGRAMEASQKMRPSPDFPGGAPAGPQQAWPPCFLGGPGVFLQLPFLPFV